MIRILTLLGLLLCEASHASAGATASPQSTCNIAQLLDSPQRLVYFTQQTFEDGAQELAVIALDVKKSLVTKRITYQRQKTAVCHYPALAIARGGDWGWFLAWADTDKLHYTRMDSEALVFVPPKKLPIAHINKIEFLADAAQPTMRVETKEGSSQLLISDDEGRNWQIVPAQ